MSVNAKWTNTSDKFDYHFSLTWKKTPVLLLSRPNLVSSLTEIIIKPSNLMIGFNGTRAQTYLITRLKPWIFSHSCLLDVCSITWAFIHWLNSNLVRRPNEGRPWTCLIHYNHFSQNSNNFCHILVHCLSTALLKWLLTDSIQTGDKV